ncbi:MAG: Spy/CpxP family protein refolding chaperone [Bacteroidia bacterium]
MKATRIFSKPVLNIILLAILSMFTQPLFAQQQDRQDRIENMHTAYITEKVGLTPEQAQKFWPVYNQFKADQDELQKQRRENARKVKEAGGIDNMSDADVQKLVENEIDIKSRELDLHKKYVVKFQEVISLKQVAKLFMAEEQFKLYLLEQLKKRRQGRDQEFVPQ